MRHTILDVQSTIWHDEYLKFRTGSKELEVMVQNLINGIFSTITTVQEGVEILEIFSDMGSREVQKKISPFAIGVCASLHFSVCRSSGGSLTSRQWNCTPCSPRKSTRSRGSSVGRLPVPLAPSHTTPARQLGPDSSNDG